MDVSGKTIMSFVSWINQNYLYLSIPGLIIGLSVIYYAWRTRNKLMLLVGVSILLTQVVFMITIMSETT